MSKCRICDGTHFTLRDGKNICDVCGTEQAGFMELQSQEVISGVDRSRFVKINQSYIEEDKKQDEVELEVEDINDWTTFEIFDLILSKWVCALNNLGASKKLKPVVFKLWNAYLQKLEVAFLPPGKNSKAGLITNKRDRQLMYSGTRSISASSLSRRKKKKKVKSLEQIEQDKQLNFMKKVERSKIRKRRGASSCNVSVTSFVIDKLSQTIDDLEATSQISDESDSQESTHTRKSNRIASKPSTTYTQSLGSQSDNISFSDSCSEYDPTEKGSRKIFTSRPLKKTKMINNWLQQKSKVYEADSSSDEDTPLSVQKSSSASGSWSSTRSARRYALRNMSKHEKIYAQNNYPQHLNHLKLLSLLYLGILLAEEDILLSDLLRWIREGHLPYLSSHHLLPSDSRVFLHDLSTTLSKRSVPRTQEVNNNTGRLAVFLNLKTVPLPTVQQIISRYTRNLRLPDMVNSMAQKIATQLPMHENNYPEKLSIPSYEIQAAAYIIFTLKSMYGLDGKSEILLSQIADRFNKLFKNHACIDETGILFSWSSWERFLNSVLWLSGQVDPACAQAQIGYYKLAKLNTETFSNYYWTEMIWQRTLTTRVPNKIEYEIIETLENSRNKTLDSLINQNKNIKGTKEPFFGSIQQYLKSGNIKENKNELSKNAVEILNTNYSSHIFDWHQNLEKLQNNVGKCCATLFGYSQGEQAVWVLTEKTNSGQQLKTEIIIPQPYVQYKVEQKYVSFEKMKCTNFKWLISSIALIYDLNAEEVKKSLWNLERSFQRKLSKIKK